MSLRRLALVVLLFFVASVASASVAEVAHAVADADEAHHAQGSSCPDEDPDGSPCSPACACSCCPGHLPLTALAPPRAMPATLPTPTAHAFGAPDALASKDVRSRVFRPPRA